MQFPVPEGATPIEDVSDLKLAGIATYSDLCAAEAENILIAMDKHLRRRKNPEHAWMTPDYIRSVHRDMFGEVWNWGGLYRQHRMNVGVAPYLIQEEVLKLCQDAAFWDSQKNPMAILERAVRVHHRLTWIHPFPNGNGRLARLMSDIYLHAHRHPLPLWPSEERNEYLRAIRSADQGDFKPLYDYTARHMDNPAG